MDHSSDDVPGPIHAGASIPLKDRVGSPQGLYSSDDLGIQSTFIDDPENDSRNRPDRAPWKYAGYKTFCQFVATENAFLIVRRFGSIHARVLLSMQDDIVQLEQKLDDVEKALTSQFLTRDIDNGSFRRDIFEERGKIIKDELPKKLVDYHAFINGYVQVLSRPDIHPKDLAAVKDWLQLNSFAIDPEESRFIHNQEDLICIKPKNRYWFGDILEWNFFIRLPGMRRYFLRRPRGYYRVMQNSIDRTTFQDDRRVEGFSSMVVAFVGLCMLIGPLWILNSLQGTTHRLGVISGFIGLFFVLVRVVTRASMYETLGAAAAYAAVLMVFLQAVA